MRTVRPSSFVTLKQRGNTMATTEIDTLIENGRKPLRSFQIRGVLQPNSRP